MINVKLNSKTNLAANLSLTTLDRRSLLRLGSASSLGLAGSSLFGCAISTESLNLELQGTSPFALGVASGAPQPTSVVLWTRLATAIGSGKVIPDRTINVQWEIAEDDKFSRIVGKGVAQAVTQLGHSIHVQADNLRSERKHWFRFRIGDASSAVGMTTTTPQRETRAGKLRLVLGSCQHWEQGYFSAWKHAVTEQPDVILFTGDYIYEYGASTAANRPRRHNSPEIKT